MTKFGAAENEMKRLTAKFSQGTPSEYSLFTEIMTPDMRKTGSTGSTACVIFLEAV